LIIENTQEAIVDKETWDLAQKLRETNRRTQQYNLKSTLSTSNRLTGLLYCADCGGKMSNDRSMNYKINQKRDSYLCSSYRHNTAACTIHYIRSEAVEKAIYDFIKKLSVYVLNNEMDFIGKTRDKSDIQCEEAVITAKQNLSKNQKRCSDLDNLIQKLFEEKVSGILSEKRFKILTQKYEREHDELEKINIGLKSVIENFTTANVQIGKFIELMKKYADFTEITTPMLYDFVDKVIVYERNKKKSPNTVQRIDVYLNFVGIVKCPEE